jgi:hypothetical protein
MACCHAQRSKLAVHDSCESIVVSEQLWLGPAYRWATRNLGVAYQGLEIA